MKGDVSTRTPAEIPAIKSDVIYLGVFQNEEKHLMALYICCLFFFSSLLVCLF